MEEFFSILAMNWMVIKTTQRWWFKKKKKKDCKSNDCPGVADEIFWVIYQPTEKISLYQMFKSWSCLQALFLCLLIVHFNWAKQCHSRKKNNYMNENVKFSWIYLQGIMSRSWNILILTSLSRNKIFLLIIIYSIYKHSF